MSVLEAVNGLRGRLRQSIIGQERLVDRLLIALLCDGHLLVEGAPGLAKTRAIKELSSMIDADYQRIQFTPDLLPADITGTEIYRPTDGTFKFQQGPLFNNLVLADEINRAPAKVQSALLEAMAEQQISVGHKTYPLPNLFMVMATQNPIEQEGTYPLPEAQLDRFLMHVRIDYPDASREQEILQLVRSENSELAKHFATTHSQSEAGGAALDSTVVLDKSALGAASDRLTLAMLFQARSEVHDIFMAEDVEQYLLRLVTTTRQAAAVSADLARWIAFGASPRGTLALDASARAHAWLHQRDYVSPEDIQAVVHDVLRHRILLSYEAEADAVTTDTVIDQLLSHLAVP